MPQYSPPGSSYSREFSDKTPSGVVKTKIQGINAQNIRPSIQGKSAVGIEQERRTKNPLKSVEIEKATSKIDVQSKRKQFEQSNFGQNNKNPEYDDMRNKTRVSTNKEFEDKAATILEEMRRQRRHMKLQSATVEPTTRPKKVSSWRDTINKDNGKGDSQNTSQKPSYLTQKRNSISDYVGKVIRKLSSAKQEDSAEKEVMAPLHPTQFTNPLDFILMKEDFIKKNPPPQCKVDIKKEGPEPSMASIMDSLKKIVKKINPNREFPSDIMKREKEEKLKREEENLKSTPTEEPKSSTLWDARMKKYQGANITPFNSHSSRWNSQTSLVSLGRRAEHQIVDNKAVRERIQSRVLSSVHQPYQSRVDVIFNNCETFHLSSYTVHFLTPVRYKSARAVAICQEVFVLDCTEFRKRELPDIIAHFNKDKEKTKKKPCHAKAVIFGLNDTKSDRYSFALVTRSKALWETVKPINVAVKMKTELFAPKIRDHAMIVIEGLMVATIISPGTSGSTAYCEQHKWDHLKGCALFGNIEPTDELHTSARVGALTVINFPQESVLESSEDLEEQMFYKCERKPQSQLVKVGSS